MRKIAHKHHLLATASIAAALSVLAPAAFAETAAEASAEASTEVATEVAIFTRRGVELNTPIVTTCGSGISAAILMLALEKLGAPDVALYDGSWAEWGGRDGAPVATG